MVLSIVLDHVRSLDANRKALSDKFVRRLLLEIIFEIASAIWPGFTKSACPFVASLTEGKEVATTGSLHPIYS